MMEMSNINMFSDSDPFSLYPTLDDGLNLGGVFSSCLRFDLP